MKLTDTQQRGLLAFTYRGDTAFESNKTDARMHTVYWQTVTTLWKLGFVQRADSFQLAYPLYQLTDAGKAARADLAGVAS